MGSGELARSLEAAVAELPDVDEAQRGPASAVAKAGGGESEGERARRARDAAKAKLAEMNSDVRVR